MKLIQLLFRGSSFQLPRQPCEMKQGSHLLVQRDTADLLVSQNAEQEFRKSLQLWRKVKRKRLHQQD